MFHSHKYTHLLTSSQQWTWYTFLLIQTCQHPCMWLQIQGILEHTNIYSNTQILKYEHTLRCTRSHIYSHKWTNSYICTCSFVQASLVAQMVKNLQCRRPGLDPGSGRSPGEGNGNPLQHSSLENPMDRGAWRATVHGITESDTTEWLAYKLTHADQCTHTYTHTNMHSHLVAHNSQT